MSALHPNHILYPMFAMFALTSFVFLLLGKTRFGAVRSGLMKASYYKTFDGGEEPESIRVVTRHFLNLFEVPVLFYFTVLTTYVTDNVTTLTVALAWLFVACRLVHSYIHLGSNNVIARFRAYLTSFAVVVLLWGVLLVSLLSA